MASLGAKVLQVRSVELAMVHGVRTFVRSSFDDPDAPRSSGDNDPPGTLICDEEEIVEKKVVTGIAYSKDEAQITLRRVADKPGVAAAVFGPLAEANINVDMIVQNISEDGTLTDITFTVPTADYERVAEGARGRQGRRSATRSIQGSTDVAKVSVIGIGMRSHAGVAADAFKALAAQGHQHPGDHDLGNQDIGADRRRLYRACGTDAAFVIRARQDNSRRRLESARRPAAGRDRGDQS